MRTEHDQVTHMDNLTQIDQQATATTNDPARTRHGGNVGARMVPFYLAPGQRSPEDDQGDAVVVWYDDLIRMGERESKAINLLRRLTLYDTCEFNDCAIHDQARAFLSEFDGKDYR